MSLDRPFLSAFDNPVTLDGLEFLVFIKCHYRKEICFYFDLFLIDLLLIIPLSPSLASSLFSSVGNLSPSLST